MDKAYVDTVRLLLDVAPDVFSASCFAMKGGTALNLFVHDMPRLSVDIDVVYVPHGSDRDTAINDIEGALGILSKSLTGRGLEIEIVASNRGDETKLLVRRDRVLVKVEVNHVFRGTLLPPVICPLTSEAEKLFTTSLTVPTLAIPELYGSKIVAALDRQHPRDLFDVYCMYRQGGLREDTIECFVCYLAGHNRPVHEVLFSRDIDIKGAYENEFDGMTREPVTLPELCAMRSQLRADLLGAMTESQKKFLLSLVSGSPDWTLMRCSHLAELPAIRWKLQNLARLRTINLKKFKQQHEELKQRFSLS